MKNEEDIYWEYVHSDGIIDVPFKHLILPSLREIIGQVIKSRESHKRFLNVVECMKLKDNHTLEWGSKVTPDSIL